MKINIDIDSKYEELQVVVQTPEMTDEVTEVMNRLKGQREISKDITIIGYHHEKMYILKPDSIIFIYTSGSSVLADTMDESYHVKDKLYVLEERLQSKFFVRISKSAIVNINQIKNIEIHFNGSLVVKFHNGKEEIISRRYVTKVKQALGIGGK